MQYLVSYSKSNSILYSSRVISVKLVWLTSLILIINLDAPRIIAMPQTCVRSWSSTARIASPTKRSPHSLAGVLGCTTDTTMGTPCSRPPWQGKQTTEYQSIIHQKYFLTITRTAIVKDDAIHYSLSNTFYHKMEEKHKTEIKRSFINKGH